MKRRPKCVIIGSGLGGLACGVILGRNGYDVTVLEQHYQPGGCLQCFSRGGVRFETGMHFIGSALPGQALHRLMRYLGLDSLPLSRLDPEGYDEVSMGGERYRFANGREPFIETMASHFPAEKDSLARYFDIIESIAAASSLHSLRAEGNDAEINAYYQTVSVNSVLDSVVSDPALREVLAANVPLYGGRRDRTPFSQHAFITDFYNRSAFRVAGGSDAIARGLVSEITAQGGEVRCRSRVTRVLCNESRATGVEINGSEFMGADIVISDIHPSSLMSLVESRMLRPAFRSRLTSLDNTAASFSVFLRFKPGAMPYHNRNFYGYDASPWSCEQYTGADWPRGYLYMHHCAADGQQWAESGVVLAYMDFAEVAQWSGTAVGRRGADYDDFKRRRADALLARVEADHPGLRGAIAEIYTATPLTYLDYTGTPAGSMYGVARDITHGPAGRVPHQTRIPNLLMTGQNTVSHGMLGVLVGSIVTCAALLSPEKVFSQITEANTNQ